MLAYGLCARPRARRDYLNAYMHAYNAYMHAGWGVGSVS
jgi:hypothetical protein